MSEQAKTSTTVVRRWGQKEGEQELHNRHEAAKDISAKLVRGDPGDAVRVTVGVNTKVSESCKWGPGTWDKVNYSVEVFSSVSVQCDPTEDSVGRAQELAYDLAWHGSRESLGRAVVGHEADIRTRLYPELFEQK